MVARSASSHPGSPKATRCALLGAFGDISTTDQAPIGALADSSAAWMLERAKVIAEQVQCSIASVTYIGRLHSGPRRWSDLADAEAQLSTAPSAAAPFACQS